MLQSFYLDNSIRSSNCVPNQTGLLHSCPFCRCKSLDASINMYVLINIEKYHRNQPLDIIFDWGRILFKPKPGIVRQIKLSKMYTIGHLGRRGGGDCRQMGTRKLSFSTLVHSQRYKIARHSSNSHSHSQSLSLSQYPTII